MPVVPADETCIIVCINTYIPCRSEITSPLSTKPWVLAPDRLPVVGTVLIVNPAGCMVDEFVKIPYDLEKEEKYFTKSFTNKPMTSKFAFQYINIDGDISTDCLDVDKSFEGKIILFPSKQVHTVFPFYTSNDYRVTVSGNIRLKID